MPEIRTYTTEMQIDAGSAADFDLEVDGYYHPPEGGHYLGPPETRAPPEPPLYLIFRARARNLSLQPVIDPMGKAIRRDRIAGKWVDLPITLFTPDQIRNLELQAANSFAECDAR